MQFSVLMSVYKNEKVEFFKQAMDSVINQTVVPNEIVLVRDGEVYGELQNAINEYLEAFPGLFTYIPLEENGGLGKALNLGLIECRYELVARMDTDDICVPDRFEKQLKYFVENPQTDIVGGNIAEFSESIETIIDYRCVPRTDEDIKKRIKDRSPLNHVTVMFRKQAVIDAGNYQHFYLFEDWYLWLRMYLSECVFANLGDVLCYVRVSDMAQRRGGMKYYKSCKKLLKFMRENKIIGYGSYLRISAVRFVGYVVCPNSVRKYAYKILLRNNRNTAVVDNEEKMFKEV